MVVSTEERVLGMRPYIRKPTEIKTLVIETMGILTLVIDVEKIQLCWPLKFNALANVSLKVFFFPSKLEMSFVYCFLGPSFLETFLFFENFNEDFFLSFYR